MRILECSTAGDIRFSAFGAYVKILGKNDTIENHYQLSKRFGSNKAPSSWRDAKGKNPSHIQIGDFEYPKEMLSQWYKLLWCIYLDKNPHLVEFAEGWDDFRDTYKSKNGINCQADVIRQYVREGRDSVISDCMEILSSISANNARKRNGTIK